MILRQDKVEGRYFIEVQSHSSNHDVYWSNDGLIVRICACALPTS